MRQVFLVEPRLYGRGRRRHPAARGDPGRAKACRRARRSGCTCRRTAAGRWPDKRTRQAGQEKEDDHGATFNRRDVLKGSSALALTRLRDADPRAGAGRRRAITPALIEAAKKEGKVVCYTSIDLRGRRAHRQGVRGEVPRRRRCGSSAPAPSGVPAHRPGIFEQHPRGRRGQHLGRRPCHRLEARRLARAATCRRTWPSTSPPSTRTRTARSPASASRCARSATTPTW